MKRLIQLCLQRVAASAGSDGTLCQWSTRQALVVGIWGPQHHCSATTQTLSVCWNLHMGCQAVAAT